MRRLSQKRDPDLREAPAHPSARLRFVSAAHRADTLSAWFPAVLLALSFLWLWPNLAHPSITSWDEGAHQAATRGIFDTGVPTILPAPLEPVDIHDWMRAKVFLHKPPLPFFLGALLMHLIGITPLALRLVSFASAFVTSFGIYFFGRRLIGTWQAALMSSAFLALPFGLTLVQGYQFGDVTDCSLLALSVLSVCLLTAAVERDSLGLALVAGAFCGLAFLCKTWLALTPLGIAGGLCLLGAWGWGPRVRWALVLGFAVAAIAVAAPWNVYSALRWPDIFSVETKHALGFLGDPHRPFSRPLVGFFDPVLSLELAPWPVMLFVVAGLWLVRAALDRRDLRSWVLCLWLWGEWIPLALARVKVPAHAWGAAAASLLAAAVLLRDSRTRPWLSGAAAATFGTEPVVGLTTGIFLPHLDGDAAARAAAIAGLGIIEGLVLAMLGGLLAGALGRAVGQGRKWVARSLWGVELALVLWVVIWGSPRELQAERARRTNQNVDCYSDEVGRALDSRIPDRSILFFPAGSQRSALLLRAAEPHLLQRANGLSGHAPPARAGGGAGLSPLSRERSLPALPAGGGSSTRLMVASV